jgi:hypothetical protein
MHELREEVDRCLTKVLQFEDEALGTCSMHGLGKQATTSWPTTYMRMRGFVVYPGRVGRFWGLPKLLSSGHLGVNRPGCEGHQQVK